MIEKLDQTESSQTKPTWFSVATILAVSASAGCGYLFLFIYERNLFFTGDRFALTVLALAISLPVLVINTIGLLPKPREGESVSASAYTRIVSAYLFSGSVTVCCVYGATILIGYFFDLSTKAGVLVFLALEILFALIMRWATRK